MLGNVTWNTSDSPGTGVPIPLTCSPRRLRTRYQSSLRRLTHLQNSTSHTHHLFKMHCRESLQLPLEKFFRLVDENLGLGRVVIFTPSLLPPSSSSPKKCQFKIDMFFGRWRGLLSPFHENVNDVCFFFSFSFFPFPFLFSCDASFFCGCAGTMLCVCIGVVRVGLGQRRWPQVRFEILGFGRLFEFFGEGFGFRLQVLGFATM